MNLDSTTNILVTGADGFIGSHLTEALLENGSRVKALAYYNSFNNWGWLEDVPDNKNLEILTGDVRDPHFCKEIVKGTDVIFHLAALIAIPYSYIAPDSYFETNVKGTLNICQAAKENGNIRFIHTSTSEVYGTAQYVPIDEKHPLQPQSPYSASKIGADAIAMSFKNSFNLPVIIARPFNTYGPRQSARAIIPTIITQIAKGTKSIKLGDTRPTRDFNFVKDICQGFIQLAQCDAAIGEIVNIGSNREVSIIDIFNLIKEIMGSHVTLESEKQRMRPENSEVFRLCCNNKKIHDLTGYRPKFDLDEGLSLTIDWFKKPENLIRYKTELYNV
jgi:NAD dependent epimerase/dehydratase